MSERTVEERLATLEKAVEAQRQEVQARRFVVVNKNGEICAVLGMTWEERPELWFIGESGNPRVRLGLNESGPALTLADEDGEPCARLGVDEEGISGLSRRMQTRAARPALDRPWALRLRADGAWLVLYHENGRVIWRTEAAE